jgi:hypothetical protein
MIECVFTIDYEIYGNGEGSLRELVYEPAERLMVTFRKWGTRFVVFVEVAELEMIEAKGTDQDIALVKRQIRDFYRDGFQLGLHLHPQWYNARYDNGRWLLDYSEYNLCKLPRKRIVQIVDRSIAYLRNVLGVADFTPLSFRAGNWLFQPTRTAASVLAERGIKVDSSVFKGGLRYQHNLDYRRALRNGHFWRFMDHADIPDPEGALLELPIHTQMVPFWKMLAPKRVSLQHIGFGGSESSVKKIYRLMDFMRFWHPLKLDFSCMSINEVECMLDGIIREDRRNPASFKPIVAIGHTKDLVEFETVESFISYLGERRIKISTFTDIYHKCR